MSAEAQSHSLDAPGARLHYEVRGTGPVLALIGHPMDSTGFAPLGDALADEYTVVTYDPRGISRSPIDDPEQDADPDLIADDVHRVLATVGDEPAYVFGSSGGAITGIALATRHPEQVRTLVAHEPPLAELLPEAEQARATIQDIYNTHRSGDTGGAWQKFFGWTGIVPGAPDEGEAPAPPEPPSEQDMANAHRMMTHGLLPITGYRPDFDALRAGGTRVVAGIGATSTGQLASRTSIAFAERLGREVVEFPGDHVGFLARPQEFAVVLRTVLGA